MRNFVVCLLYLQFLCGLPGSTSLKIVRKPQLSDDGGLSPNNALVTVNTTRTDATVKNSKSLESNGNVNSTKTVKADLNLRPIIGVLAQEKGRSMRRAFKDSTTSYIAASYVKYLESAGARVVPIMINQPAEYYVNLTKVLNGVIFPGGSASITNTSGYGMAGQMLYDLVMAADPPLPLWGTCLGFEMLMYLGANQVRPLSACKASNRADPLILQPEWKDSDLIGGAPIEVVDNMVGGKTTSNFHKWCVLPQNFTGILGLNESFKILTTTTDDNDLEYVSTVEHRTLPVWGTQWHPEKVQFEWARDDKHDSIPHEPEALAVSHYMAHFFVQKARENKNHFPSEDEEIKYLIYNYAPVYSAIEYGSAFQQIYLFEN